jgi:hypothetical protein
MSPTNPLLKFVAMCMIIVLMLMPFDMVSAGEAVEADVHTGLLSHNHMNDSSECPELSGSHAGHSDDGCCSVSCVGIVSDLPLLVPPAPELPVGLSRLSWDAMIVTHLLRPPRSLLI